MGQPFPEKGPTQGFLWKYQVVNAEENRFNPPDF